MGYVGGEGNGAQAALISAGRVFAVGCGVCENGRCIIEVERKEKDRKGETRPAF